jgi:hypothetical protein
MTDIHPNTQPIRDLNCRIHWKAKSSVTDEASPDFLFKYQKFYSVFRSLRGVEIVHHKPS